jgi:hypothetical protein
VNHTHQIVGLRLAIGFLGEQERSAWWSSHFLGRHAHAFLSPIFGSKIKMAQYHGVTEAACRVHDEKIGVGRVFHLYRLPETTEHQMSSAFQEETFPDEVMHCFESLESAESFLGGLAQGAPAVKSGPVRLGSPDLINTSAGVALAFIGRPSKTVSNATHTSPIDRGRKALHDPTSGGSRPDSGDGTASRSMGVRHVGAAFAPSRARVGHLSNDFG